MTEPFFFVRPATGQRLAVGERLLPNPLEKVFLTTPKVGLVISTFAAAPYVELALAIRQRGYPEIPALVHDDASDQTDRLSEICARYGADFQTNSSRLEHEM